jgi:hypothetical protein
MQGSGGPRLASNDGQSLEEMMRRRPARQRVDLYGVRAMRLTAMGVGAE